MPGAPAGPDAEPAGIPLTLDQCVAQALGKNFSVKIQTFPVDSAQAAVIVARSAYDPVLGVTWQKTFTQSPQVTSTLNTVGGGAKPTNDAQSTVATVSQPLITGGTVTGAYQLSRQGSNTLQSLLNPAYDGQVSLNVSQPLLQGAGADYGRAAIEIAQAGQKIAADTFRSTVLTAILNVETAYYNLIFNREQYAVAQDSLKLAQQLLDENTVKRQTGVLTDLDVVTAQAGVATARNQVISDRQAMQNAEDTLLAAMGEQAFRTPVGDVNFPALPSTGVDFYSSYKLARDNGPSLAIAQATIDQLQLDALRAKRNALPALAINGGVGYTDAEHSYNQAANNLIPGPGYNYNAGVTLSFPWGLREERALYREAKDSLAAEQSTFDQADQQLTVQVRASIRAVSAEVENVAAAGEAATLSEKQYELQKGKFDAGLATSYDVLQVQVQLATARVAEIQAQVSLRSALANLHFLEGTSLQTYHVNLN